MPRLTRRAFGAGLAAGAALPMLPLPAKGAAAAAISHHQKLWGAAIVRAQGARAPGLMVRHLGLAPATAEALAARLAGQAAVVSAGAGAGPAPAMRRAVRALADAVVESASHEAHVDGQDISSDAACRPDSASASG